jgi:hypothetical protein
MSIASRGADEVASSQSLAASSLVRNNSIGGWDTGLSTDVFDMIWSFLSQHEQCRTVTPVCHQWMKHNQNGFGWNNIANEKKPFDLLIWHLASFRDPSPSIRYTLLHHRWHHITSLHLMVEYSSPLLQPKLLVNVREINVKFHHHTLTRFQDEVLDILVQFSKLESLSVSGLYLNVHPTSGWSSCSSLTSLSLLSRNDVAFDPRTGGWENVRHITFTNYRGFYQMDGSWSFPSISVLPSSLPSLTSLEILGHRKQDIRPLLQATIGSLTSLSISGLHVNKLEVLVPYLATLIRLDLYNLYWEKFEKQVEMTSDQQRSWVALSIMSLLQLIPSSRRGVHGNHALVPSGSKNKSSGHGETESKATFGRESGKLAHLGLGLPSFPKTPLDLPASYQMERRSLVLDDILPLIAGLTSFTITDGSQESMKWITTKVKNGSLPLLQTCALNDPVNDGNFPKCSYRFSRHQIIHDGMLKLVDSPNADKAKSAAAELQDMKASKKGSDSEKAGDTDGRNNGTLISSSSSSSSSTKPIQSMTRSEVITLISSNPTIMDHLFSYLNAYDKWFIAEHVCRSWLHSSKVIGCGWKSFIVPETFLYPEYEYREKIEALYWSRLIGRNRLARQRNIRTTFSQRGPSFTFLSHYFPRMTSLKLDNIGAGKEWSLSPDQLFRPLSHFPSLISLSLTVSTSGSTSGRWIDIPLSLRYLYLSSNIEDGWGPMSIPITWQQQLRSLTLTGQWLPQCLRRDTHDKKHEDEKDGDEAKALGPSKEVSQTINDDKAKTTVVGHRSSLTSFIIHTRDTREEDEKPIKSYLQLFQEDSHLIPNLIDIRLNFGNHELISTIVEKYPKLKRFDIGRTSPLSLLSLTHLTSFGIVLSHAYEIRGYQKFSEDNQLMDDVIKVVTSLPSISHLKIRGAPTIFPIVKLLRSSPFTPASSSSSSTRVVSLSNDSSEVGKNIDGQNDYQVRVLDLSELPDPYYSDARNMRIPKEWRRVIDASDYPSFLSHLLRIYDPT